jgi:hypothetical protein
MATALPVERAIREDEISVETFPVDKLRLAAGNPRRDLTPEIFPEWIPRRGSPLEVRPYPEAPWFGVLDGRTRLVNMRHHHIHTTAVRVHWYLRDEPDGSPLEYQVGWELNFYRKLPHAIESFLARAAAGHPIQAQILAITKENGLTVARNGKNPHAIACTNTMERLFAWGVLEQTLGLTLMAWPDDRTGRDERVIYAIGVIQASHPEGSQCGSVDPKRLLTVASRLEPLALRRRITARREAARESLALACLRTMEQIYNRGLKEPLLEAPIPPGKGEPGKRLRSAPTSPPGWRW